MWRPGSLQLAGMRVILPGSKSVRQRPGTIHRRLGGLSEGSVLKNATVEAIPVLCAISNRVFLSHVADIGLYL